MNLMHEIYLYLYYNSKGIYGIKVLFCSDTLDYKITSHNATCLGLVYLFIYFFLQFPPKLLPCDARVVMELLRSISVREGE